MGLRDMWRKLSLRGEPLEHRSVSRPLPQEDGDPEAEIKFRAEQAAKIATRCKKYPGVGFFPHDGL